MSRASAKRTKAKKAGQTARRETKPAPSRWWPALAAGVLIAAVAGAYANSFSGVFLFDDDWTILQNTSIRSLDIWNSLTGSRRPVVNLSLAVNYAVGGLEVWGYHAFNLGVHILSTLTLFGLIRRTLIGLKRNPDLARSATSIAAIVAGLWAIHPLQTQSVTYIIQRGESLMGLFYLLTLYCVQRSMGSRRAGAWQVAAVLACAAGMGSKAVMVTAPLIVLLYDRTFGAGTFRDALRQRWPLYIGLACTWAVLVGCGVVGGVLLPSAGARGNVGFAVREVTPLQYVLSQPEVIVHYLELCVWPARLCLDYAWPVADSMLRISVFGLFLLLLLMVTAWATWRRPAWGFVGAWFFVILAPTSSIIPIKDLAFEHRMYLPIASVVIVLVMATRSVLVRVPKNGHSVRSPRGAIGGLLLAVVVSLFVCRTADRNRDYQSEARMWQSVVAARPSARAHNNLAKSLKNEGQYAEAVEHCRAAIKLGPNLRPRAQQSRHFVGPTGATRRSRCCLSGGDPVESPIRPGPQQPGVGAGRPGTCG